MYSCLITLIKWFIQFFSICLFYTFLPFSKRSSPIRLKFYRGLCHYRFAAKLTRCLHDLCIFASFYLISKIFNQSGDTSGLSVSFEDVRFWEFIWIFEKILLSEVHHTSVLFHWFYFPICIWSTNNAKRQIQETLSVVVNGCPSVKNVEVLSIDWCFLSYSMNRFPMDCLEKPF